MIWSVRYSLGMQVEQASVLEALKAVRDPDLNRDIVGLGFVKDLNVTGGHVAFTIELTTPACPVKDQMRDQARAAVMRLPGVTGVDVQMSARVREAVDPAVLPSSASTRCPGNDSRIAETMFCSAARSASVTKFVVALYST